ncbi:MAG: hypothetical protein E7614_06535 [Ruminococcaceae bacterium]|nr:hypothetical protein [Oscillospiraceae bacterium]
MAHSYPSSWKNCATCAFWLGERDTDHFYQRVLLENSSVKGRCCNKNGWRNCEKSASQTCNAWEKWPVLK